MVSTSVLDDTADDSFEYLSDGDLAQLAQITDAAQMSASNTLATDIPSHQTEKHAKEPLDPSKAILPQSTAMSFFPDNSAFEDRDAELLMENEACLKVELAPSGQRDSIPADKSSNNACLKRERNDDAFFDTYPDNKRVRHAVRAQDVQRPATPTTVTDVNFRSALATWRMPRPLEAMNDGFWEESGGEDFQGEARWITPTDAKRYFEVDLNLTRSAKIKPLRGKAPHQLPLYQIYHCAKHFNTVTHGTTWQALRRFLNKNDRQGTRELHAHFYLGGCS